MNKSKKRMLSAFLTICMIFGMTVCAQAGIASKVKIRFNGKTVTFNSKSEPKTLAQLEKKWGKKKRIEDTDNWKYYVWEKGQTTLKVAARSQGEKLGHISVLLKDTNASVAGVQVGMEKDEAIQNLQSIYGEKCVLVTKDGQSWDFYGEDGYIVIGKPKSDEERINVLRGHFYQIFFYLTDGKVSRISWTRS